MKPSQAARIAGGKAAREIFEAGLLTWENGTGADFADRFLEVMAELLPRTQAAIKAAEAAEAAAKPQPIARLGATVINYGEYAGSKYDDIPVHRLEYYLVKAEENTKSLRAYLNHPEFKSYRGHT